MKPKLWMAFGVLAAQAASAGVYVEMVDHDIKANTTTLAQKIYVQNGNGRFVDADGHATLIKDGTFYIIDDNDKTYVVFDKATMEKLAKKMNDAMEQMKAKLAQLPPEQIVAFCSERLASFKLPRYIAYYDELPKTPSGKIAKPSLREISPDGRVLVFFGA